jgi:hypothetical protein
MSPDRRRHRGLVAAVADDLPRKLIAIGLAVLMWFFIDSRVTRTHSRIVPLVTVGAQEVLAESVDRLAVLLPTGRVVGVRFLDGETPVDRVEVLLSGPRFRINAIEEEPLNLAITAFLAFDWSTRSSVEFTAVDIRRDQRMLQDVKIELRPSRVRLLVERLDETTYTLSTEVVDIQGDTLGDRLLKSTATFSPDTAVLLGPAISIERLRMRGDKPFRAVVKSTGNERQVTASLEIVGGDELDVRFQTTPSVTMQVRPQTSTYVLELPIVVDDLALPPELRGQYRPETATRAARIRAGGNLRSTLVGLSENPDKQKLNDWVIANLRLQVYIPRPESGVIYAPVMDRQAWLVPAGPMVTQFDRSECLLEETVVVKLRRNP